MARPAAPIEELSAERIAQLLAAAQRRRPQLTDLLWHEDEAVYDGLPVLRRAVPEAASARDPSNYDPVRRRIRDRYISVRFAGVARGAADLENPTRVIKAARLSYEEHEGEIALEMLRLAIGQNPAEPKLRLAEMDLAFRLGDAARFRDSARAFQADFPASPERPEVERLGRSFAASAFARDDGADTPCWIEEPWDATPTLDAAEFHRAMTEEASRGH